MRETVEPGSVPSGQRQEVGCETSPWKMIWRSAFQTHTYEPLYLANGTFGGLLDLSGSTMDLWSSQWGGWNLDEPEPERVLWPVTALRTQVYYQNPYCREAGFWVGGTGIHSRNPDYIAEPSMPHLPQTYHCQQVLDLDSGLATTGGTYYMGSQAALEAGLAPERALPFETRVVLLKDSPLMGIEITSVPDVEICFSPEPVLEERLHWDVTGSGIARLGTAIESRLRTRQTILSSSAGESGIHYEIQPEGGAPYRVVIRSANGKVATFNERPAWVGRGSLFVTVEILPCGSAGCAVADYRDFEVLAAEQRRRWAHFWAKSEVQLPASEALWQQRYQASLFYVAQSMGDGPTHPVGLSKPMLPYWPGCFHDTDTYFCRALLEAGHANLAAHHLRYRARILPAAMERAARIGRSGALYSWATDSRGRGLGSSDVPMNGAIIACEAWNHYLFTGCPERLLLAHEILAATLENLADHLNLNQRPLQLKPGPLMTFSETMRTENPTEVRIACRAVAATYLASASEPDSPLAGIARRVLDELNLPIREDGSYAIGGMHDPEYLRCPSVTLGSFPLHHLPADAVLARTFDKELARIVFLFAFLPHQASIVASQLGRAEGPLSACSLLRQADEFYKTWHAFDEWENRRTARAAIFVTAAGAFCLAVNHLLLSETGEGIWTAFAAVPDAWQEVSFRDLHTTAGWRISAKRAGGKIVAADAHPIHGQAKPIRLVLPFPHPSLPAPTGSSVRAHGTLEFALNPGQPLTMGNWS